MNFDSFNWDYGFAEEYRTVSDILFSIPIKNNSELAESNSELLQQSGMDKIAVPLEKSLVAKAEMEDALLTASLLSHININRALTPDELAEYMAKHKNEFCNVYKASTLRIKANSFEIPAMQHSVRGDTIRVDSCDKKKQRWTFLISEIKLCEIFGSGRKATKEVVRQRDYTKIAESAL
jgi:hypothetical protein